VRSQTLIEFILRDIVAPTVLNNIPADSAKAIPVTIDAAGSVYVAGRGLDGTNHSIHIQKFNAQGVRLWERHAITSPNFIWVSGMTTGPDCALYLTGFKTLLSPIQQQMLIAKLDSSGNVLWTQTLTSPDTLLSHAWGVDIAFDNDDRVFVQAALSNSFTQGFDFPITSLSDLPFGMSPTLSVKQWVMALSDTGAAVWDTVLADTDRAISNTYPIGLSLTSNSLYLGYRHFDSTYYNYGVHRLDPTDGSVFWDHRYSNGAHDVLNAIEADDDAVYLMGSSQNTNGDWDVAARRISTDETVSWTARYNGPGNTDDFGTHLYLRAGNLFMAGKTDTTLLAIRVHTDGALEYAHRYSWPYGNGFTTQPLGIVADTSLHAYMAGFAYNTGFTRCYQLLLSLDTAGFMVGENLMVAYEDTISNQFAALIPTLYFRKTIDIHPGGAIFKLGLNYSDSLGYVFPLLRYQPISAANPNNPYDFVGREHNRQLDGFASELIIITNNLHRFDDSVDSAQFIKNVIIDYVSNVDSLTSCEISSLKESLHSNDIALMTPQQMQVIYDTLDIADSTIIFLESINNLIDSSLSVQTPDYFELIQNIKSTENQILSSSISQTSKSILLSATSVSRYSSVYWANEINKPISQWAYPTLRSAGSLADAVQIDDDQDCSTCGKLPKWVKKDINGAWQGGILGGIKWIAGFVNPLGILITAGSTGVAGSIAAVVSDLTGFDVKIKFGK
jgi:hypothetical protein